MTEARRKRAVAGSNLLHSNHNLNDFDFLKVSLSPSLSRSSLSLRSTLNPDYHLKIMSTAPLLSASVTRILILTGFSPDLKTKDFQQAFSEYENLNGGFKIKWVDDTSLLLVFHDAGVGE